MTTAGGGKIDSRASNGEIDVVVSGANEPREPLQCTQRTAGWKAPEVVPGGVQVARGLATKPLQQCTHQRTAAGGGDEPTMDWKTPDRFMVNTYNDEFTNPYSWTSAGPVVGRYDSVPAKFSSDWDNPSKARIHLLQIRSGDVIDCVRAWSEARDECPDGGFVEIGGGGGTLYEIQLEDGDYITGAETVFGYFWDYNVYMEPILIGLRFFTAFGATHERGHFDDYVHQRFCVNLNPGGQPAGRPNNNWKMVGIQGKGEKFVEAIGFTWRKVSDEPANQGQLPPDHTLSPARSSSSTTGTPLTPQHIAGAGRAS